jgi:hypothetical protein
MGKLSRCWAFLLFFILAWVDLNGQDNHYQWMQYGSRNSILFNAGVSRFEDQTAVILNPATLSYADQSSFNFNTNVVGFNSIRFEDGLGQGYTLKSSGINVLPSMASGVFKPSKKQKDWVLGYALYHSNTDNLEFSDRVETRLNILNEQESPGTENYLAQYNLSNRLDEFSTVVGLGWRISDKMSLGFSQTFTYRTQEYREDFAAYVLTDPAINAPIDLVGANIDYFARYNSLFTFTKLGLHWTAGKWDLGLTLASPTFSIFGSGRISADYSLTNIRVGSDMSVPRQNFLANGQIEDIKARYKYPFIIQAGASRAFGHTRIYGSFGWYGSLSKYTVMDPGNASFLQPANNSNILQTSRILKISSQNRSIWNASLAVDHALGERNHLLLSVRTDNHYGVDGFEQGQYLVTKLWNNYHITVGNQRQFAKSTLIFGVRFNYGSNPDYPQPISFVDPSEGNFLGGDAKTGKIRSIGMQAMVSYMFNIGKK